MIRFTRCLAIGTLFFGLSSAAIAATITVNAGCSLLDAIHSANLDVAHAGCGAGDGELVEADSVVDVEIETGEEESAVSGPVRRSGLDDDELAGGRGDPYPGCDGGIDDPGDQELRVVVADGLDVDHP